MKTIITTISLIAVMAMGVQAQHRATGHRIWVPARVTAETTETDKARSTNETIKQQLSTAWSATTTTVFSLSHSARLSQPMCTSRI